MSEATPQKLGAGGLLAGGGAIAALASLLGASCCVLPLSLVQLGVSTAMAAHLAMFTQARPFLLATAAIFLTAGASAAFWGSRRPQPMVLTLLAIGALLVLGSALMPHYESALVDWLRER